MNHIDHEAHLCPILRAVVSRIFLSGWMTSYHQPIIQFQYAFSQRLEQAMASPKPQPDMLANLPPIPEDEFCVFGRVTTPSRFCFPAPQFPIFPALLSPFQPPTLSDSLQVYAHRHHADALEQVYALTTKLAKSEPGIIYYCICRDSEDPTMFHFFERYTGREAFETHNRQPVIVKLLEVDRYIERVDASFVKPILGVGGKGGS